MKSDKSQQRATDLTEVDPDVLDKLSVNNLDCERDLAIMDKLAKRAAACSNRKFNAKGMKDKTTIYQAGHIKVDKETKQICKLLDEQEKQCFESQQKILKSKIAETHAKALHQVEYVHILLAKCKKHGGPFVSINELDSCLTNRSDEAGIKRILRLEISYRRHTSSKDFQFNPELYKVNPVSVAEMKVNLAVLLSNEHVSDVDDHSDQLQFPSEEDIMKVLQSSNQTVHSPLSVEFPINEPCVAIWDEENGRQWYIGMMREHLRNNKYLVDHLELVSKDKTKKCWRYPAKPDEHEVELVQIIPCNFIGTGNMRSGKSTFEIDN